MTEEEARRRHIDFLEEARRRTPGLVPKDWSEPARIEERDDSWVFVYKESSNRYEVVLVRKDGSRACILLGAIGKVFRKVGDKIGLPRSNERWLGSGPGRYQLFDRGLVIWDRGQDIAYPRFVTPGDMAGRRCFGIVAFTDLRGFTTWSRQQEPQEVQKLVAALETLLQECFSQNWCQCVFVKGTGDGMMIVSERDWFASYEPERQGEAPGLTRRGHVSAFLLACGDFIQRASVVIPRELGIGCGIDLGELDQVFVLGQSDYLGEAANNASKLQQLAWNEIVVSPRFGEALQADGDGGVLLLSKGKPLADRGIRIDAAAT